ncbi:MAG: PRC-barrel domain-containing protein [Candidatus Marsarchaeota archaeon]|nr:PRC-barrel domain-containing protein [Candidatus Marsarchaeota archaeon]
MGIMISELYGKGVLSNSGNMLGTIKEVVVDLDNATVTHLLLSEMSKLTKSSDLRSDFLKNSIEYKRVKKVAELVIVGERERS